MAYAVCEFDATDEAGNLLPGASVEVRRESGGLQVVYADRDGLNALGSLFVTESGNVRFYAPGGAYRVTITLGPYIRVLRHKAVGLAAESDYVLVQWQGEWDPEVIYLSGDYVVHNGRGLFVSITEGNNLGNEPVTDPPATSADWVYYPGVVGNNSYTYIAYASDDQGTDFTTVFDPALDYIAILTTLVEINPLTAPDFAGLWKRYKGDKGWSPTHAFVADGDRRVLQLTGYVGGEGVAPTAHVGEYLGIAGYTAVLANGVDLRGLTGRGFLWIDEYDNGETYFRDDVVRSEGSTWIALQPTTGNAPPSLPITSNAFWSLFTAKGQDGQGTGDMVGDPEGSAIGNLPVFRSTDGKSVEDSGLPVASVATTGKAIAMAVVFGG